MKSFKDFVAGAVVATIAVGGVTTAFARSGKFQHSRYIQKHKHKN